jgi:CheY-like chemotaxis protein
MTPEKILIIDDNPANIGLLSEGLERMDTKSSPRQTAILGSGSPAWRNLR